MINSNQMLSTAGEAVLMPQIFTNFGKETIVLGIVNAIQLTIMLVGILLS